MIQYIPIIGQVIDKLFPDPNQREIAKAELTKIVGEQHIAEMEAKSKVIVAEAQGDSWMQRNWRPCLMFLFMFILAFNFILAPIAGMLGLIIKTLPIPNDMWFLLSIGVGGYIGGRSAEKISKNKNEKSWFDAIRAVYGHMNQQQVDAINDVRNRK